MNTFELKDDIENSKKMLAYSMDQKIASERRIVQSNSELLMANIRSKIAEASSAVDKAVIMLRENDPRNILSKGYAAVTDTNGAVITTVNNIVTGNEYTIRMTDGSFVATAVKKNSEQI
jgi:exodeoxyribonuclease VII large subunit